jgi:hypothetical protein
MESASLAASFGHIGLFEGKPWDDVVEHAA